MIVCSAAKSQAISSENCFMRNWFKPYGNTRKQSGNYFRNFLMILFFLFRFNALLITTETSLSLIRNLFNLEIVLQLSVLDLTLVTKAPIKVDIYYIFAKLKSTVA